MKTSALLLAAALCTALPTIAHAEPHPARAKYRNPEMRIAGIVLTSIASASLVSGAGLYAYAATCGSCGESGAAVSQILAIGLGGLSVVLAGIGVPLWVVGARPPAGSAAADAPWVMSPAVPSIAAGPRGAVLRWSF